MIEINTGEVGISKGNHILTCRALGSCIALVLIDKQEKLGGIAHIMLPGKAPPKSKYPTRYAENAIKNLIAKLSSNKSSGCYLAFKIGGGNVLKREDDIICKANSISILEILNEYKIPIIKESVGGFERRSVKYHVLSSLQENYLFL